LLRLAVGSFEIAFTIENLDNMKDVETAMNTVDVVAVESGCLTSEIVVTVEAVDNIIAVETVKNVLALETDEASC
jgi:hypothetical protein